MSARSAHTIHRFNGLSSFMRKVALKPQSVRESFSFVQKGNCDERGGQLACVYSDKKGTPPTRCPTYQQLDLLILVE